MSTDAKFDKRVFIRFSRLLSPAETVTREDLLDGPFEAGDLPGVYQEGRADGVPELDERARLTPSAIRRSRDPIAKEFLESAFNRSRFSENRFNRKGEFGALYLAFEKCTAAAEVKFHWLDEAKKTPALEVEPAEYLGIEVEIGLTGRYLDLRRGVPAEFRNCLLPDQADSYQAGQALGAQALADGYDGLIYQSVRRPVGKCFALYDLRHIVRFRQGPKLVLPEEESDKPNE